MVSGKPRLPLKIDGRSMDGKMIGARFAKHLQPIFVEFVKILNEHGYEIVERTTENKGGE